MANATFNIGIKPVKYFDGRPYDGAFVRMYLPATYNVDVFVGDPVVISGTSNTAAVSTCSSKYKIGTLPEVILATAGDGNVIDGVIVGFDPTPASVLGLTVAAKQIYGKAATERVAHVVVPEGVLFEIRDDASGTLTAAAVGSNAVLASGSGSTLTGIGGFVLDATTPTTTNTYQLKIKGVADKPQNDVGVSCIWEVTINNRRDGNAVAGV